MLDLVIKNGQVITPQGVGAWDVGIQGEQIAVVGRAGLAAHRGARVIDAAGMDRRRRAAWSRTRIWPSRSCPTPSSPG